MLTLGFLRWVDSPLPFLSRTLTINPLFKDERDKIVGCPFLKVEKAENLKSVRILRDVTGLDAGESEALIIYDEKQADLLLIDEHKGRSVAKRMSVEYIGTPGIFMLAYDKKILSTEEILFFQCAARHVPPHLASKVH